MHVFTYGSLMFPEVWRIVVDRDFETIAGSIAGYEILRVSDAPYPGIRRADATSTVHGLVYLDMDEASAERLDRFEGDFYERLSLPVDCSDGQHRAADAYVVPANNHHLLTAEPWTAESFVSSGGLAEFLQRYQGFSWLGGEG